MSLLHRRSHLQSPAGTTTSAQTQSSTKDMLTQLWPEQGHVSSVVPSKSVLQDVRYHPMSTANQSQRDHTELVKSPFDTRKLLQDISKARPSSLYPRSTFSPSSRDLYFEKIASPGTTSSPKMAELEKRGYFRYKLKPQICPCPMHDGSRSVDGILRMGPGSAVHRSGSLDWHSTCGRSNRRHASTGIDTFGAHNSTERTKKSLPGPHRKGYYSFPRGIDGETKCAMTGEQVLKAAPVSESDLPESCGDHGFRLPLEGSTFIVSHKGEIFKDTPQVIDGLLAKKAEPGHFRAAHADAFSSWGIDEVEASGALVVGLPWNQNGQTLVLPKHMATDNPTDYHRVIEAWENAHSSRTQADLARLIKGIYERLPSDSMIKMAESEGKSNTVSSIFDSFRPYLEGRYTATSPWPSAAIGVPAQSSCC